MIEAAHGRGLDGPRGLDYLYDSLLEQRGAAAAVGAASDCAPTSAAARSVQ